MAASGFAAPPRDEVLIRSAPPSCPMGPVLLSSVAQHVLVRDLTVLPSRYDRRRVEVIANELLLVHSSRSPNDGLPNNFDP